MANRPTRFTIGNFMVQKMDKAAIEEAGRKHYHEIEGVFDHFVTQDDSVVSFAAGAKWMQEQMTAELEWCLKEIQCGSSWSDMQYVERIRKKYGLEAR
jgi:sorbitol-specific phosphotransferase system component IIC